MAEKRETEYERGRRHERADVVTYLDMAAMFGESETVAATLRLAARAIRDEVHMKEVAR